MQYAQELKEAVTSKALKLKNIHQAADEAKIPYQTVYNWVMKKKKTVITTTQKGESMPIRPQNWSADAKLQAIIETSSMNEEEIGAYCRSKGIYTTHLQDWKKASIEGLKSNSIKNVNIEYQKLQKEYQQVKRDLNRKDKALAETSALLVLKKKADLIWGVSEEDES